MVAAQSNPGQTVLGVSTPTDPTVQARIQALTASLGPSGLDTAKSYSKKVQLGSLATTAQFSQCCLLEADAGGVERKKRHALAAQHERSSTLAISAIRRRRIDCKGSLSPELHHAFGLTLIDLFGPGGRGTQDRPGDEFIESQHVGCSHAIVGVTDWTSIALYNIDITVRATGAAGTTVTNTATITSNDRDSNPANNQSTATTKITN